MNQPMIDVPLSYRELTVLRQRLNVQLGDASFGAVNSELDAKLYRAQADLKEYVNDDTAAS